VTLTYDVPFKFIGRIAKVTIELKCSSPRTGLRHHPLQP